MNKNDLLNLFTLHAQARTTRDVTRADLGVNEDETDADHIEIPKGTIGFITARNYLTEEADKWPWQFYADDLDYWYVPGEVLEPTDGRSQTVQVRRDIFDTLIDRVCYALVDWLDYMSNQTVIDEQDLLKRNHIVHALALLGIQAEDVVKTFARDKDHLMVLLHTQTPLDQQPDDPAGEDTTAS